MRNEAVGAILDSVLYVRKITAAFVAKRKERTATEHTVEHLSRGLVTGKVFTFFVFEIGMTVFHTYHLLTDFIIADYFKKIKTFGKIIQE